MRTLRALLAVSFDGFVAKGVGDTMTWTGSHDKRLFRLLTTAVSGVVAAGRTTVKAMPKLPLRQVVTVSRSQEVGIQLEDLAEKFPGAWVVGPTIALEALRQDLLLEVVVSRINYKIIGAGIKDCLRDAMKSSGWNMTEMLWHEEVTVETWRSR